MKKTLVSLSILALGGLFGSVSAQVVDISPRPHNITWGAEAFASPDSYVLTGGETADADAVALLGDNLTIGTTGVSITIGERGDAAVSSVESLIPNKAQGYYLSVSPEGVVIAGNDSVGTYYGVQTFLRIAAQPQVMSATVTDWPDVLERGAIEGFYGNPWSTTDRKRQFQFYGRNKMNIYVYGPKDDPYHRARWREPYPAAELAVIKELVAEAAKNKVQFVWAIHPGNDIQWTNADSLNVVNKLEKMYDAGVRTFAVFFDDIYGEGEKADKQAGLLNFITDEFVKKHNDVAPLIMCPTQYNRSWTSGTYLTTLGSQMYPEVRIMWTGNSVVDMINKSDMDWINAQIGRNAFIWLNYPVTDYCSSHLLMGRTYGNDLNIAEQLSGFASNPMEYAEASKVSLFSIADYTWNMAEYDDAASWELAMKELMPTHTWAFRTFCEHNVDLGVTTHGLRREGESAAFRVALAKYEAAKAEGYNAQAVADMKAEFDTILMAANELLTATDEPEMMGEITPWVQVMKYIGERGQLVMNLHTFLANEDPENFIATYLRIDSLQTLQKDVISRDFPGSIVHPHPVVGAQYVEPFLKSELNQLVSDYKSRFDYRLDVFPAVVLDDGAYFIKYNNRWLTNTSDGGTGGYPIFKTTVDDVKPQRQVWNIKQDAETSRYKITNAQDGRYINENGVFTVSDNTNPYDPAWHSYNIYRLNNRYAIQNAGSAGNAYWTASNIQISKGSNTTYNPSNFIFEIQPTDEEKTYPVIEANKTYCITVGDLALTNTAIQGSGGYPQFKAKKATDSTKSQEWIITVDATSNRYKIVSAADSRYINEKGEFGTNSYLASWNTYELDEVGGLFAIRNGGDAGTNFWTFSSNRIGKTGTERAESYLFTISLSPRSTGIGETVGNAVLTYTVTDNAIRVNGATGLQELRLVDLQGRAVRSSRGLDVISTAGLDHGQYVLVIKGNGWQQATQVMF